MQTQRRNFMLGGAAALTVAAGLAMGAQVSWPQAFAAEAQPQVSTTAPISAAQQRLATIVPEQEVLARLYEQASPSVVNIQVTMQATSQQEAPSQSFPFPFPFGQDNGQEQTPQQAQAEGSGFVYDSEGHIVTNNHVVEGADPDQIIVNFANGEWAMAKLIARDPQADLAVLQVTPPADMTLQPLPLATKDSLRVGYYVAAIGSPFGLDETMTMGVVSALGRSMPVAEGAASGSSYSLPDLIQTDTAINPGNSGGPLLNMNGEVVGVNFAINSPVRANAGVGFAIPVSVVEKVVPALIKDGAYHYAYLGIAGQSITAGLAQVKALADNTLGVYVGEVSQGGPAAKAGLQAADIITGIDQQKVYRFEDLLSYLFNSTAPDQQVTLHILRNGQAQDLDVTLTARPTAAATATTTEQSGTISVTKAVQIAKDAVTEGGLITQVDAVAVKQAAQDGQPVWVVTLSGEGKEATVTINAHSGEVIGLDVQ
ncbi:MAG: trypsin-like peptidase domain-containing protein [Caldilineaceae bacterium]|nr:trypsin-like peptidase domain-containing protein [Caldilineaceae bacterium]